VRWHCCFVDHRCRALENIAYAMHMPPSGESARPQQQSVPLLLDRCVIPLALYVRIVAYSAEPSREALA
jgi:hypothetical protein